MMQNILCIMSTRLSEIAKFCTINDTAVCPQNDGCTEVEERPFIVFLSDKTHTDYGLWFKRTRKGQSRLTICVAQTV